MIHVDMSDVRLSFNRAGSHWFSAGAMRFFRSRISNTGIRVGDFVLFVSSEAFKPGQRRYTARIADLHHHNVATIGDFNAHSRAVAWRIVREAVKVLQTMQIDGDEYRVGDVADQLNEVKP